MNLEEHATKRLVLAPAGISVPRGILCASADEAERAAVELGPVMVKAQAPTGKRGKAGGVRRAATPSDAAGAAKSILGMMIGKHRVTRVLVEAQANIRRELYAAVTVDAGLRCPVVLLSTQGGMEVEEAAALDPRAMKRAPVNVEKGFALPDALDLAARAGLGAEGGAVAEVLVRLYAAFARYDGELIEVNPLAVLGDGNLSALDGKFTLDDAAASRQPELAAAATPDPLTELERRGAAAGLRFIELDGRVGVLANGAGLTMTTMDVIGYFGGRPANFLEIGGEAYTKAEAALSLVLAQPELRSMVINFCGAFARTDVMADGVVRAWLALKPKLPVFFSIHGTNEAEAVALVRERLGIEPYDRMEDAVRAAVEAAR
jgi:succinyl-CoA synthetase beta subunit